MQLYQINKKSHFILKVDMLHPYMFGQAPRYVDLSGYTAKLQMVSNKKVLVNNTTEYMNYDSVDGDGVVTLLDNGIIYIKIDCKYLDNQIYICELSICNNNYSFMPLIFQLELQEYTLTASNIVVCPITVQEIDYQVLDLNREI